MCRNFINITACWFVEGLGQGESIVCALQWLLPSTGDGHNIELQARPPGDAQRPGIMEAQRREGVWVVRREIGPAS